ncbi:MAG: nucleotide exchange factor GrpE [Candidatus Gastranaerophilales bacterium]|nr:nucleotide exchange factor GrpE [Candidatus Gastranaerophilales bacterium]
MSKHKHHHSENSNTNNPFSNENGSETIEDIEKSIENIENTSSNEEEDEVIYVDNNEEPETQEETAEETQEKPVSENTDEQKNTEEKKGGILNGLFGKKSDEEAKKLKEAYDTLNNQYLRLAADFENYRKRQESERESLIKYGMEQALKKMIEIADNFARAEKAMETIDDCEKAKESFNVLNKQFKDSLSKLGLEEIKAEGEMFNPNLHEAVMQVPTDEKPEETIMQEMQKGYKYGDKVLRPSMVSVAVSK